MVKDSEYDLKLVAWNIESGDNDPKVIAEQLKDFSDHHVMALNEVNQKNIETYVAALGNKFGFYNSNTGGGDRLVIMWNRNRFELLSKEEMDVYRDHKFRNGKQDRSPIFVRLKDNKTGQKFIVMTNHLASGKNNPLRMEQAVGLREWARESNEPIIAMGDFNFKYSIRKKLGDSSFAEFMKDSVWHWVKPSPMIDSHFSEDGKGNDRTPDSILDFVFVANGAKEFEYQCSIIKRDGDFPDDESTSDHRATELRLNLN